MHKLWQYTDAEFDDYAGRMSTGRAYSITIFVLVGVFAGGIVAVGAFALHWVYAWFFSGVVTWMFSLVVGGIAAALAIIGLWLTCGNDGWTDHPPELATDVTATAYAAWRIESDTLDVVFAFRVEADHYLLITENALTPPLLEEHAARVPTESVPSSIGLVLMGEGEFRIAMNVSLTGLAIPLVHVGATPADGDDETPIPDGLYMTNELPARIRSAIGVA
ncbi:MAG: hypothetical protein NTV94_17145 [Planctomycetota bacterium]|nr:hypothetical protein [Planctomycetota bacterium]